MLGYMSRRLALGALTVFGVSILVFGIMRVLPGDPLVAIFGPDGFTRLTEDQRAGYMAELGLSDPLHAIPAMDGRHPAAANSDAPSSAPKASPT